MFANWSLLHGKLLWTRCAHPTFQRQRLPYSKLLEHDHKQSDNNNNGNNFHAIQTHDCRALDGTCTIVLFKKQLQEQLISTVGHPVSQQTTIFFLRLLHFLLAFLCRHQLLQTLKRNPWLKPLTTQKKIIKAVRPKHSSLSKPVRSPSSPLATRWKIPRVSTSKSHPMPSPLVANPPLLALASILDLISDLHVPQFCQLRGSTSSLCRVCVCACAHDCVCVWCGGGGDGDGAERWRGVITQGIPLLIVSDWQSVLSFIRAVIWRMQSCKNSACIDPSCADGLRDASST